MLAQSEETITCPYCWESINILVDTTIESQEYVEDCQICCNPILMRVESGEDLINIQTAKEDDGF